MSYVVKVQLPFGGLSAFTVNSANAFDMVDAAGHLSYVEDTDGTLIEPVETHKVPIGKAMVVFLNLKKRNSQKTYQDGW